MEFFAEYAGFLARTVTVLVAILVVLAAIAALRGRNRRVASGHLDVRKLNDFYKGLRERLEHSVLDKAQLKAVRKAEAKAIEKERDSIRSAADIEAERLEQQADAVRKAADAKADAMKSDTAK